jgi:hypothetical protein
MTYVIVVALGLLLAGCTAPLRGMHELPAAQVNITPPADQAAVVFMRGKAGGSISSSLFDLREPPDQFIGILVYESRLLYLTTPGRTRFMVVGQTASFMDADLVGGKTYYVGVVLGGLGEETFELRPLRAGDLQQREARRCAETCAWLANTEKSQEWARYQWSSIQRKKARYLPQWERRTNRPALLATDGR